MFNGVYRTTKEGAEKVLGWLEEGPEQIIPEVRFSNFADWMLGLTELVEGIFAPTIIFLNIDRTALPRDLAREIIHLSSGEHTILLARIDTGVRHDPEFLQALDGRVSRQILKAKIPGFEEEIS